MFDENQEWLEKHNLQTHVGRRFPFKLRLRQHLDALMPRRLKHVQFSFPKTVCWTLTRFRSEPAAAAGRHGNMRIRQIQRLQPESLIFHTNSKCLNPFLEKQQHSFTAWLLLFSDLKLNLDHELSSSSWLPPLVGLETIDQSITKWWVIKNLHISVC